MTLLRLRRTGPTLAAALCALLAFLLIPAAPARATILREMSLQELAVRAPHVVRGTVLGTVCQWSEDGKGILTYVDVTLEERIKGGKSLPDVIQVIQPGGELDGVSMKIIGGPTFREGEEVVLFLYPWSDNPAEADMTMLAGGPMGRMQVVRDPEDPSKASVIRRFDDLEFARFVEEKDGSRRMVVGKGPEPRAIPLDELRRRVSEAAAAGVLPGLREAGRGQDEAPAGRGAPGGKR